MATPWKGKHLSAEHRKHISEGILKLPVRGRPKGIPSSRKGKKIDRTRYPRWGFFKKHSIESKRKMRTARLGVEPWNKGKRGLYAHSEETKVKIAATCRRVLNTPTIRQKLVEFQNRESVKIARLERIKTQRFIDTDIEIKLQQLLDALRIPYRKQERIADITVADLYLPDHDLYIFCDGNYWHSMPQMRKKDERQNRLMKRAGIKFIRFWGKEILRSPDTIKAALQTAITATQ